MTAPQLWVLAGGNGAGKSTFYTHFLAEMRFVNADLIARDTFGLEAAARSYDAAVLARGEIKHLFAARASFCFETVFSHPSKVDLIAQAKGLGYEIHLVILHLSAPELHVARVSQRVAAGGHAVPEDKIRSRLVRAVANLRTAIPLCDTVLIVDNSFADGARENGSFAPAARISDGTAWLADGVGDWVLEYLA